MPEHIIYWLNIIQLPYHSGYTLTNNYCPDTVVIMAEGITTFCEGESVLLFTEDHHLSYLWVMALLQKPTLQILQLVIHLLLIMAMAVCTSNIVDIEVEPNPLAVIDLDGPAEFCEGGGSDTEYRPGCPRMHISGVLVGVHPY